MKRRSVVLGAAGFLGSHLVDALLDGGNSVIGVDDLSSGSIRNIAHLKGVRNFEFIQQDINENINVSGPVSAVFNFASLASPQIGRAHV